MKQYIGFALGAAIMATMTGCEKENPFRGGEENNGTGMVSTASLEVSLKNEEYLMATRAETRVDVGDCRVAFVNTGTGETVETYTYSMMPEVVTLPVGEYKVTATYGENLPAAWDSPYYEGETTFSVEADRITTDIEPVVCTLANMRVSIIFDPTLVEHMVAGSKVTVNAGTSGSLDFTVADQIAGRSGYFAYEAANTLTATFTGTVDGGEVCETKAFNEVKPGTHYKVTFRLHTLDDGEQGSIIPGGLKVDASVNEIDVTGNIAPEDEVIPGDDRPEEGGDIEDPEPPVSGDITTQIAVEGDGFDLDNFVDAGAYAEAQKSVRMTVRTQKPIEKFQVTIKSATLDPETLEGVGLTDSFDLCEAGSYSEGLSGLGFPVNENVKGQTSADLEIDWSFLQLMGVLGAADHLFEMEITTADGTRTVTLKIRTL